MYTLQEKLQQEEDHTQQALQREKEKAREEYTKFVLAAGMGVIERRGEEEVERC